VASVGRAVSGGVGRRRTLTAPALQRACFSEMVRHVRVRRDGRGEAPSRYVLHLHPDDLAVVDETRRWFHDGLVEALREAARTNGWTIEGAGGIDITYQADPHRRPGVPSAEAVAPGSPPTSAPSGPPATGPKAPEGSMSTPTALVRVDTGAVVALSPGEAVTIGRSRDRTIVVDDDRASRAHAHLEPSAGTWAVVDDGSSNGTLVNGVKLTPGQPQTLRVGDIIGIGPIDVRVDGRPPAEPGPATSVLAERDRTRIASTVLPPRGDRP
ncbi:MAG: FhaA domain-containing protein, partial [Acidimicrobiales bacterium]